MNTTRNILIFILFLTAALVQSQPVITITANGSTASPITVCTSVLLTASGCSGCTSYQWKLNGSAVGTNTINYVANQSGTYTCTGTNPSGSSVSNAISITVIISAVSISSGGATSFCNNAQQVTLTATNSPGYTYQWYRRPNGGSNIISGATSQTYQPPVNVNETYQVYATNQNCTSGSNLITVSYFTTPPPAQSINVYNNQTWLCPSGFNTPLLYLAKITGFSYQWKINGNPVVTNCSGYNACIGPLAAGLYSCDITNACGSLITDTVAITQSPTPVIAVNGYPTGCGGTVGFSISNAGSLPPGTTYQWKRNSMNLSFANNSFFVANLAGDYTCDVSIPECGITTPAAVTIYTNPNIDSPDPLVFCSGGATLRANPSGGTYQWKNNGAIIPGATGHTYYATASGSYTCVITPSGCSASTSNAINVTAGVTSPIITAPNGYDDCNGGTVTLSVSNVNNASYQWGNQNGDINGETLSSFNATATGLYYCRVTESCGTASVYTQSTVRILPDNYLYIQNNVPAGNVCGSADLYVTNPSFAPMPYDFQWFRNDTAVTAATYNNYYMANQVGTYTCHVSIPGCSGSYPVGFFPGFTITNIDTVLPPATTTPKGKISTCTGQTITLTVPACADCLYQFYEKVGNNNYAVGNGSNSYSITQTLPVIRYYFATIQNACNTVTTPIDTIVFTQTITAVTFPSGSVSICSGSSVKVKANTGIGFSYQWKKNGNVIAGATLSSYTVTVAGSYTIVVTASCGTATSSPVTVSVNNIPSATITASGPTTFCSGDSVILNAPVAANRSYQWRKTGISIPGATGSSYTAKVSGTYKVTVTNTNTGCSKLSSSGITVVKNALPAANISPQGPTTFCAGGSVLLNGNTGIGLTYNWKRNGVFISGATLPNYTATAAGTYKVQVTNSNGCSAKSQGTVVTVPCRDNSELNSGNDFKVSVYPNPSSGDFNVDITNSNERNISITIFDITGRILNTSLNINKVSDSEYHILNLNVGIYSAIISDGKNQKLLKLIKTE